MFYKGDILKNTAACVCGMVLCILLVVASKGYFRFDDFTQLWVDQFEVIGNPSKIITESGWNGHYRPMEKLFFTVTHSFFGLKPLGYFIVLITLFLLTQCTFFLLVRTLSGNVMTAYSAVLVFLLQGNLYLYTVGWISAACTIVATLFGLMSLLFYVKSTKDSYRARLCYLFSFVCFCVGLLSKESNVVFLPLFIGYDFLFLWLGARDKSQLIRRRFRYHVPFWVVLILYIVVRSFVAGARGLTGGDSYAFTLGSNVLDNILFYGMQLGFIPVGLILLSSRALLLAGKEVEGWDLRPIALGILLAISAILPFLFFSWHSPTWTYLSAFGTSLAAGTVFQRVFSGKSRGNRTLLLYGTLVVALIGNGILFLQLSEARWWHWGTYSKNVIERVQADYPNLPSGARVFFIDKNPEKIYGVKKLFRIESRMEKAFQVWYLDRSLHAYIVEQRNASDTILEAIHKAGKSSIFVFEYDEGTIVDKTKWFRSQEGSN